MAGHSASQTRVNALLSRPSRSARRFVIGIAGTSPAMTAEPFRRAVAASADVGGADVLHRHKVTVVRISADRVLVTELNSLVRGAVPDQVEGPVDRVRSADRLVDGDIKLGSFAVRVQRVPEPSGMAGLEIADLLPAAVAPAVREVDGDVR